MFKIIKHKIVICLLFLLFICNNALCIEKNVGDKQIISLMDNVRKKNNKVNKKKNKKIMKNKILNQNKILTKKSGILKYDINVVNEYKKELEKTLKNNSQNITKDYSSTTDNFFNEYGNKLINKYTKMYENMDSVVYSATLDKIKEPEPPKPQNAFVRFFKTYIFPDKNQIFKDGQNMAYAWSGYDMMPSVNSANLQTKTNYGKQIFYNGGDVDVKRVSYSVATGWAVPTRFWGLNGRFSFGLFTMIMQQNVNNGNLSAIKYKGRLRYEEAGDLRIKLGNNYISLQGNHEQFSFLDNDGSIKKDIKESLLKIGILHDKDYCYYTKPIDNRDAFLSGKLNDPDDIVFRHCYKYYERIDEHTKSGYYYDLVVIKVKDLDLDVIKDDNDGQEVIIEEEPINYPPDNLYIYDYINQNGTLFTKTLGFETMQEVIFGHQNLYLTVGFGVSYMFVVEQHVNFANQALSDYINNNMQKQLWNNSEFNWVATASLGHRFDCGLVVEATVKHYSNFSLYAYDRRFVYLGLKIGWVF